MPINNLFRLQNVSTQRRDKINSDEEERQRQGYEIRTAIRFARRSDGQASSYSSVVMDDEIPFARLTYGQSATLWRINFGPMRRRDKAIKGFVLDTERGYWGRDDESIGDPEDPMSKRSTRVIPFVEDTRNCLLFEPLDAFGDLDIEQMASLQAALKSAIQIHFQLEDNELAAEPLPDQHKRRYLLFYEAAEGGAGVLRQFIDVPTTLQQVARTALMLCHFDPDTGHDLGKADRALEACEAACYSCLMNYGNQRDHEFLDRHAIKEILLRMARAEVEFLSSKQGDQRALLRLQEQVDHPVMRQWLQMLHKHRYRLPTHVAPEMEGIRPDFVYLDQKWGDVQMIVYVDGDDPERQQRDIQAIEELQNNFGYTVIRFGASSEWEQTLKDYFQDYFSELDFGRLI